MLNRFKVFKYDGTPHYEKKYDKLYQVFSSPNAVLAISLLLVWLEFLVSIDTAFGAKVSKDQSTNFCGRPLGCSRLNGALLQATFTQTDPHLQEPESLKARLRHQKLSNPGQVCANVFPCCCEV